MVCRLWSIVFYILKSKNKAMKKLLAIVAIASFLAACNNSSENSTNGSKDSVSADSPLTDAVNTADSVNKKMEDSTGKIKDTLMK
jgi:uncharacterized lipoprotein YajG